MPSLEVVLISVQALSAAVIAVWSVKLHGVTKTQSRIQARQLDMEKWRDRFAWAPIVVSPDGAFYRSPDTSGQGQELSNIGPGTALDMAATLVRDPKELGDPERVPVHLNRIHLTKRDGAGLGAGAEEYARYVRDGLGRGEFIIIHYRDIFGDAWHTTINIRESKSWGTTSADRVWAPWDTPNLVSDNCTQCQADARQRAKEKASSG